MEDEICLTDELWFPYTAAVGDHAPILLGRGDK
jgi:hypothetical protein